MDNQKRQRKIYISLITEKKLKEKASKSLKETDRGWLSRYLKFISETEFILLDDNTSKILRALLSSNGDTLSPKV